MSETPPEAPLLPLEAVHAATHALLAALDGDDLDSVILANAGVSQAIGTLHGVDPRNPETRALLESALAATEHARVRLKILEDANARKLVVMAKLSRHVPMGGAYGRDGRIAFARERGRV